MKKAIAMACGVLLALAGNAHASTSESGVSEDALTSYVARGQAVPPQLREQLLARGQKQGAQAVPQSADEARQLAQAHLDLLNVLKQARSSIQAGRNANQLAQIKAAGDQLAATFALMQVRFAADSKRLADGNATSEHQSRQTKFASDLIAYYSELNRLLAVVVKSGKDNSLPSSVSNDLDRLIGLLETRATQHSDAPVLRANALPYGALSLSPRTPVTSPAIVPSYAQQDPAPVAAADGNGADEAPLNDEVIAQARALNNDYVRIYEFVRNQVRTEWYAGALKGAVGTLHSLSGNDVDQASLLIALLRAAGLPARYVTGVVELPVDQLAARIGVTDASQVTSFLSRAGQAYSPVTQGGRVAAVRIAHTWVSAYVPYTNYRGALVDASGKSWIPLDASFKLMTRKASSGAYSRLGSADKLTGNYLSDVSSGTLIEMTHQSLDNQLQVEGKSGSFADQLAQESVTPQNLAILPNSLPYTVTAVTAERADLTDADRIKLRIVVRQGSAASDAAVLDVSQPLSLATNARLTLSYIPATLEDHRVTLLYGGLDVVPLYLINLRPQIKLGGRVIALGEQAVAPGKKLRMELYLSGPFGQQEIDQNVLAGAYHAIVAGDAPSRPDVESSDNTEYTGAALLDGIGTRYARRWTEDERTLANLTDVALVRPVPPVSIVTNDYTVNYAGGLPVNLVWQGVSLDAAFRPVEAVGANSKDFLKLSALQGSSLEHAVFEEQFAVNSISADKGFALANQAGVALLSINAAANPALAASNHSAEVKASVESLVRQGYVVTIPAAQITYADWTGSVWRAVQPDTLQTGYFISGQLAGGATAQKAWPLDFLADALKAINSNPANRDVMAVTGLHKIGISEKDMQGRVDELLPTRLSVRVLDQNQMPVSGASVAFTIAAGDAKLVDDKGGFVSTTVAKSNALGIASVSVKLGTSTSVNPIYVNTSKDKKYATRASYILIDAAATGSEGIVRLDEPFEVIALPGEVSSLARVDTPLTAAQLHPSIYAGTLQLRTQDKFANPVANEKVDLEILSTRSCASDDNAAYVPGVMCKSTSEDPVLGGCEGKTKDSLTSDSTGMINTAVILGNDPQGISTVWAYVGKNITEHYRFIATDSCGTVDKVNYSAWTVVGTFDINGAGKNITAASLGSRFPRPMQAKVYASSWAYKLVDGRAVFQPSMSVIPADGQIDFELQGGSALDTQQIGKGAYQTNLYAGWNAGFEPLFVSSPGVEVPIVYNENNKAKFATASVPIERRQQGGLYAVKPVIDEISSEGAPIAGKVYLDANGGSLYPLKVSFHIEPDTYTAESASLDIFQNGARVNTLETGDNNGVSKTGSFYIPRTTTFDIKKSYDAQLRLNWFGTSSVLSERKAIPVNQGLISMVYPEVVTIERTVDAVNSQVCDAGRQLKYGLIRDAVVSLYYQAYDSGGNLTGQRQPLFESQAVAAGNYIYKFDTGVFGTGRFQLTLEAVDASDSSQKDTRNALLISKYVVYNALPVGQTMVNGVNVRTGTMTLQASPLVLPGRGPALSFNTFYSTAGAGQLSAVGTNWSHNLDLGISIDSCGTARVAAGDSGTVSFLPVAGDKFQPEKGYHGTLVANRADQTFDFFSLDGTKYHYTFQNAQVQWKIDSITDRNGNVVSFEYDKQTFPNPRLTAVRSSDGRMLNFKYEEKPIQHLGANGSLSATDFLLTEVTGTGGRTATLEYDQYGNMVAYALNGRKHQFVYNVDDIHFDYRDRVKQAIDPNGNATQFSYKTLTQRSQDQNYKAIAMDVAAIDKLVTPLGESLEFTYDENAWKTSSVKRFAGTTTYEFNTYGSATKVTDPVGTTEFTWADRDILLMQKKDARGVITAYTYDDFGNTTSETVDGITSTYAFKTDGKQNARNLLVEHVDRNKNHYTFDHDDNGNVVAEHQPEGVVVTHQYASNGDLLQTTDGNKGSTRFEYNGHGLPVRTTLPTGAVSETPRNLRDLVIESTDGRGNRSFMSYDVFDQLVQIRKPLGYSKTFSYDDNGNKIQEIDENGIATTWTYNAGNLPKSTLRSGVSRAYDYDVAGNKISETDGRGATTTYKYDGANRLILRTEPLGKTTNYSYDEVGNLLTEKDARGNTTTHTYDRLGRRVTTTDAAGKLWKYAYDNNGNRISQTDALKRETGYDYDGLNRQVAIRQPLGRTTRYTLDANGNKLTETDPNGQVTQFAYDAGNRLVKRTNALGDDTLFEYDLANNLTRQTDELGNFVQYEFNELNQKVVMQDPEGHRTRYSYDGLGNLLTQTLPNGNVITNVYDDFSRRTSSSDAIGSLGAWTYDNNGNVLTETDAVGNVSTHTYNALNQQTDSTLAGDRHLHAEYDLLGNKLLGTDARGFQTTYTYDALNRLKTVTHPDGGVSSAEYDDVGNKISETDPLAHKTTTDYDDLNRAKSVTDALGQVASFTYDLVGNKLTETDKRGTVTSYTYDKLHRPLTTTKAGVTLGSTAYDKAGRVQSKTDANGNTVNFEYDRRGLATATRAPLGVVTQDSYDAMGSVTAHTDGEGKVSKVEYDLRRRAIKQTNPSGEVTQLTYDLNGRRLTTTRPKGGQGKSSYDAAGNLETVTDPLGHLTTYAYNKNQQLVSVTDAQAHTISFGYNNMGQRESVTYPGGVMERFTFDKGGLLRTHTDGNGLVITYNYDALNRESSRSFSKSADGLQSIATTYDANNNPLTVTETLSSSTRVTRNTYDAFDRLKTTTDPFGAKIAYSYDANGNRLSLATQDARNTQYGYDALNRLNSIGGPSGSVSQTYDRNGRLVTQSRGNGVVATHSYDATGRTLSILTARNGTVLNRTDYTYDPNGNRTLERVNRPNGAQVTTYTYNTADQLTSSERADAKGTHRTAWDYDAVGNRVLETQTDTAAATGSSPTVTTRSYTYNARNELATITQSGAAGDLVTTYTYDDQGNQIQKNRAGVITQFTYDAHDQLTNITRDGTTLGNYRNNHLGLRIEKEAKDPLNPQGPPLKLRTLWDGHDAILDQDENSQVIARYDFAGREPIGLWHKQDGVQTLHTDALGSVVLTTDTNGAAKAETLFDAWGNPIVEDGQSANKFGFTGHQMDDESGLIYAQARYYDPETGRFLTEDPAEADPEEPLSYNTYLYAFANPTVYTDPDGRNAALLGVGVGFGVLTCSAFEVCRNAGLNFIKGATQIVSRSAEWAAAHNPFKSTPQSKQKEAPKPQNGGANPPPRINAENHSAADIESAQKDQTYLQGQIEYWKNASDGAASERIIAQYQDQLSKLQAKYGSALNPREGVTQERMASPGTLTPNIETFPADPRANKPSHTGNQNPPPKVPTKTEYPAGAPTYGPNHTGHDGGNPDVSSTTTLPIDESLNKPHIVMQENSSSASGNDVLRLKNASQSPTGRNSDLLINERAAAAELRRLERSVKNAHFVSRHGPDTTLAQQRLRATTGVTPDNVSGRPIDASRWSSYQDMAEAIQKAQAIYNKTGQTSVPIDLGRTLGDGYLKGGSTYVQTTRAVIRFDANGMPYTAYPKLR